MNGPKLGRVNFESPPIAEVVFGVLFQPLPLTTAYFGRFWDRLGSSFPKTSDQPPLPRVTETFDQVPPFDIEWSTLPPMRRVWFQSADDRDTIQLQENRIHFNRKRLTSKEPYVRYPKSITDFENVYSVLDGFVSDSYFIKIVPIQFELTYLNVITAGANLGWSGLGELENVMVDLAWRGGKDLLPTPDAVQWKATFSLPEKMGRLHVQLSSGTSDAGVPTLQLSTTARGYAKDRRAWFDVAHDWVVNAFADLTTEAMHQVWRRTKS